MATKVKPVKAKKTTVKTVKKVVKAVAAKKAVKTAKLSKAVKEVKNILNAIPVGEKAKIIEEFATKKGDTGSPEVQIALLTKRIEKLVTHLKNNPSDNHSRRGLLGMVSKRRRLMNYLSKKDIKRTKDISSKLNIGK